MEYETWKRLRKLIEKAPIKEISNILTPFMTIFGPFGPIIAQALGYGSKEIILTVFDMIPHGEMANSNVDEFHAHGGAKRSSNFSSRGKGLDIPIRSFGDKAFLQPIPTQETMGKNDGFAPIPKMDPEAEKYYESFIAPAVADIVGPFRPRPIERIVVPMQYLPGDDPHVHEKITGHGNRGPNATYAGIGF